MNILHDQQFGDYWLVQTKRLIVLTGKDGRELKLKIPAKSHKEWPYFYARPLLWIANQVIAWEAADFITEDSERIGRA